MRWAVRADNLNPWCRLSGDPFAGGLVLMPNAPGAAPPSVVYEPVEPRRDLDTFSFFLTGRGASSHPNVIAAEVQLLAGSGAVLAEDTVQVSCGEQRVTTLDLDPSSGIDPMFRLAARFEDFVDDRVYGSLHLWYALGYRRNALVDLFNRAGSDKGTEHRSGEGVPHCYALHYDALFRGFRSESFAMLEIGLDDASKQHGVPADAPSVRVWREYFPNAAVHGYDINDFSFLDDERTQTFRGDQSSPEDLRRFLEQHGSREFRLVIDDGSHASSHQQISFAHLFPSVAGGGMYVIEDLDWQPFAETPTTLEMLDRFQREGEIVSPFISPTVAGTLRDAIASVEIHRPNDSAFAVIRKRNNA